MQEKSKPVFLHGMWRCGSTYVWSKFRMAEGTYCYYEPLHQGLGRLTRERIARDTPEIVAGNSHPALSTPYFSEFEPLLERRGVRHFKRRLAFDRCILRPDENDPGLRRYIASLNDHALQQGKIPVFGFNRSGLRMGWLKHHFPSFNIHIDRDPLLIWQSYETQRLKGNYTFFECWLLIAELNTARPVFAPLAARLPLRRGMQKLLIKPKHYYHDVIDRLTPQETYFLVFYMWLACALHALSHADLILDMDRMGEAGYAADQEKAVNNLCGVKISLDDARAGHADPPLFDPKRIEKDVLAVFPANEFFHYLTKDYINKIQSLAPRKIDSLIKIKTR